MKLQNKKIKNEMFAKKAILLFLILTLSLIGTGCTKSSLTTTTLPDIYVGTEGLQLSFLGDYSLDNVYEGSQVSLSVKADNKGAQDIKQGLLILIPESTYFDKLAPSIKEINIEGKKQYNPLGKSDTIDFTFQNVKIPTENKQSFVLARACYLYTTHAKAQICLGNPTYDKCNYNATKEISLSGGQGAPVAVTKISENVKNTDKSYTIYLDIYIENVGGGKVTIPGDYKGYCNEGDTFEKRTKLNNIQIDKVQISSNIDLPLLGGENPNADGCRIVTNGKDFDLTSRHLICTKTFQKNENDKSAYSTLLTIDMSYGYTETITRSVKFRSLTGTIG